jgi:hypothetical protein
MILSEPLKGEDVLYIDAMVSGYDSIGKKRFFPPSICLRDANNQKFYLSFENLRKILMSVDYDVNQKRVRKHLIPLLKQNDTIQP